MPGDINDDRIYFDFASFFAAIPEQYVRIIYKFECVILIIVILVPNPYGQIILFALVSFVDSAHFVIDNKCLGFVFGQRQQQNCKYELRCWWR